MITLQYRASISQETGEDWKGIALTLSTASPSVGSEIPRLGPWTIGPYLLPLPRAGGFKRQSSLSASDREPTLCPNPLPAQLTSTEDSAFMAIAFKNSMRSREVMAKVHDGAVSSSFEVEGSSNIPSDGSSHKVSIIVSPAC